MHDHVWVPIEGASARYACACGQEALRCSFTGKWREVATRWRRAEVTARPMGARGYGGMIQTEGSIGVRLTYSRRTRKPPAL